MPYPAQLAGRIVSFPRAGRTWLRFLLANYLLALRGLEKAVNFESIFSLLPNDLEAPLERGPTAFRPPCDDFPLLVCTHRAPLDSEPEAVPTLLLIRDPVDQMTSLYHLYRWSVPGERFEGSIAEFVRDSPALAEFCNWLEAMGQLLKQASSSSEAVPMIISYEQLRADPAGQLAAAVQHFGFRRSNHCLTKAVEASTFDRMQKLERDTAIPGLDYDKRERNALRVRQGHVGSGKRELEQELVALIEHRVARLGDRKESGVASLYACALSR